jgi:tRNA pseudouridine38-40 synthase
MRTGRLSLLLRLGYDGTRFHGYARQPESSAGRPVRTVQGELERALATLYKEPVATRAASRTDAGVHAEGQLVAFDPPFGIPVRGLLLGLASELPPDIVALAAWTEEGEGGAPVDPRQGNAGKHYRYRIRCTKARDPMKRRVEWHLGRRLDMEAMREAVDMFVGTHDFGSFRASDCQSTTSERTIMEMKLSALMAPVGNVEDSGRLDAVDPAASRPGPDVLEVHVRGTAFLKNMVRIMVGTLVEVGLSRRAPESVRELLLAADRTRAGMTAPPQGLTLVEVLWPREPA